MGPNKLSLIFYNSVHSYEGAGTVPKGFNYHSTMLSYQLSFFFEARLRPKKKKDSAFGAFFGGAPK